MELKNPYINVKISTTIMLNPNQINNNIYNNIKSNLQRKLEGRCYKDIGFIQKIFQVVDYKNGRLEAENVLCAPVFDVSITCRLCRPVKDTIIVGQINKITRALIRINNGPIVAFITPANISNKFFRDDVGNLRVKDGNLSRVVKSGDYVKVEVKQYTFNSTDKNIIVAGFIHDVCTDDEIKIHMDQMYSNFQGNIVEDKDLIT